VKASKPFQKSPLKTDVDPFTPLLEIQKEKDKARCEAWKDEVQNLLIFVSLVPILRGRANSAVVTAFIIESYNGLKQDSGNVANEILFRILAQLEVSTNGTATIQSLVPAFPQIFAVSCRGELDLNQIPIAHLIYAI